MSMQYNSQYVDEKYLPILEPNLYTDTVIIPGVTFTNKYQIGPAGQLFVHKLTKGNRIDPGAPASNFSHVETTDALIQITLNNAFRTSKKIYGVQANSVAFNLAEENMANAIEVVRESRQYSALACMVNEGTADTDTNAITTSAGAVEALLGLRKKVKDAYGKANFALVSTGIYKLLLAEVGFVVENDPATRSAELMKRFGLTIIECNSFDKSDAKYINYAGTTVTKDLSKVEMIVGNSDAMSIVANLEAMRFHDSEDFIGTLAQIEMNMGFRVTNSDCIVYKKSAASI